MKNILILGGGYGGLLSGLVAREYLTTEEAHITMINRAPSHQIITELHRLAAGNLSEKSVAIPLKKLLRGKHINIMMDTVEKIKPDEKQVILASGDVQDYDILVIALGSETAFFGIQSLEAHSFTLKSVEDANRIRKHIESSIESYRTSNNKEDVTFVIGGGGLTGVELIGELVDMLPSLCQQKGVDFNDISLICVEGSDSILAGFDAQLVKRAQSSLQKRGVQLFTGVRVTDMKDRIVYLNDGRTIPTNTLIWTGGVQGNSVVADSGIDVNRGRATVTKSLQSTSHQDIFLAGDSAVVFDEEGHPYPPTAQIAWQMGEAVGYNIHALVKQLPMQSFEPVLSGKLASLGRKDAIASIGESETKLQGLPAKLMKEASKMRYLTHIKALYSYID